MHLLQRSTRALRAHLAKIVIVALLALPLLATLLSAPAASGEQRALAKAPALPANWQQALAWPPAADAWINDRFGWRTQMVELYTRVRYDVFGRFPTNQVIGGRGGRIFLSAHNRAGVGEPFTAIKLACGWQFTDGPRIVSELNRFARVFTAKRLDARLLIVPSAPIVYSEQLPEWQAERCPAAAAPGYAVLASPKLAPQTRAKVFFPLDEMRAMRSRVDLFPPTYFHWGGAGARAVAGLTEERFWHRPADSGSALPLVVRRRPSDIHSLFPGIELDSMVGEPEFAGTTMTACTGADCFPDLKPVMQKLGAVGRFTNSAQGLAPRLVLVTDSFGEAGAPWFARYYREVVYVSTNTLALLTREEVARLRGLLFRPGSTDVVLYLYHDATVYSGRVGTDLNTLAP